MGEVWRLIESPPGPGGWNMAVDAALLDGAQEKGGAPILRLYGWDRPTLSFGYRQKRDGPFDAVYLDRERIPLVRRPTGGRAILHDDEVTYAVILPGASGLYGSLRNVYATIAAALRDGLTALGAPLDAEGADAGLPFSTASCFASKTRFELAVDGRKIAGGAQRRLRASALQHGSIVLSMDIERHLSCFVWRDATRRRQAARLMGGLNDHMNPPVTGADVRRSIVKAFEDRYHVHFKQSDLAYSEKERAALIMNGKREKAGKP